MDADFYQWDGGDLLLNVYIQPNAKTTDIVGMHGKSLKIRISAPAVDNMANKQLLKFLAKIFGVSTSGISLLVGEHSRNKRLRISQPGKLPENIAEDHFSK